MPPPSRAGLKRDPASVGRERRLDIVGGVTGQPDRSAVRNLLDPDVQVAFAAAIGGVREHLPVERDGGIVRPADVGREPCQRKWSRADRAAGSGVAHHAPNASAPIAAIACRGARGLRPASRRYRTAAWARPRESALFAQVLERNLQVRHRLPTPLGTLPETPGDQSSRDRETAQGRSGSAAAGSLVRTAASVDIFVAPLNARRPVIIS